MTSLYVAWHTASPPPTWGPVGKLDFEDGYFRFRYTRGAKKLHGFDPFPGMPEFDRVYRSVGLFPLFANRLLAKSRPEYQRYLMWSGFLPDSAPEPLVILGRTEGRKETDAIEVFPCPEPSSTGRYVGFFFAHGIRYHLPNAGPILKQLMAGDRLQLRPQPRNLHDSNAVAIFAHNEPLGYIPRYLAPDVKFLLERCGESDVKLYVDRINHDSPMQQRLLCRLDACWPEDFHPCGGDEFKLISEDKVLEML
jgi:hypothetical protein